MRDKLRGNENEQRLKVHKKEHVRRSIRGRAAANRSKWFGKRTENRVGAIFVYLLHLVALLC